MDAAWRRPRVIERWGARLPAAYFTRIHLPVTFERSVAGASDALHIVGSDRSGVACYCHFRCDFSCPRCFTAGPRRRGAERRVVVARELWAWRLHGGKWLVCTVDHLPEGGEPVLRHSVSLLMPASVCLDADEAE